MAIWIHGRRRRRRVDFILLENQDAAPCKSDSCANSGLHHAAACFWRLHAGSSLYSMGGARACLNLVEKRAKVRGLVLSFVCMAFLMAPESFAVIYGIRIAGQLKAIVLLILFIVSITCPFEEPASVADDVLSPTRAVAQ
jgi:hypothetical protein